MALSLKERAENARHELHERYDRLSAAWTKLEERLGKYPLAAPIWFTFEVHSDTYGQPLGEYQLALLKQSGKWRIYFCREDYSNPENCESTPINSSPVEIRRQAVDFVDEFEEHIVKSIEEYVPKIDDAIDRLERAAARTDVAELLAERHKLNGKK